MSCSVVSPLVVHTGRKGSGKSDANSDAVSLRLKRDCGLISCWAMAEEKELVTRVHVKERKGGEGAWTMKLAKLCVIWMILSRQTWVTNGGHCTWTTPELESGEAAEEGIKKKGKKGKCWKRDEEGSDMSLNLSDS